MLKAFFRFYADCDKIMIIGFLIPSIISIAVSGLLNEGGASGL
jgi:hypothetical protein